MRWQAEQELPHDSRATAEQRVGQLFVAMIGGDALSLHILDSIIELSAKLALAGQPRISRLPQGAPPEIMPG